MRDAFPTFVRHAPREVQAVEAEGRQRLELRQVHFGHLAKGGAKLVAATFAVAAVGAVQAWVVRMEMRTDRNKAVPNVVCLPFRRGAASGRR